MKYSAKQTMRPSSRMCGNGRTSNALTAEKTVVEEPMPRARASTATPVNAGVFTSIRRAILSWPSICYRAESLGGDPILHYATVKQVYCSIGVLRKPGIVCDHANRSATGVQ